jgi:hypothetical protein
MMIAKSKIQYLIAISLLAIVLQACAQPSNVGQDAPQASRTPGEVPTWTPRPDDLTLTALPTATIRAPVLEASTAPPARTNTPAPPPTPKQVMFTVSGGNLNIRRGPSVDYNYVGVLYAGEIAEVVGRDRISRWVLIEVPSQPGLKGWVTTETEYSSVQGDVSIMPFVKVEPASPAYIRNCTKHEMLVLPNEVELLSKFDKPYNEERFGVGFYQVYDLENPHREAIQEISLSEGRTVDILFDWTGEKSKCE